MSMSTVGTPPFASVITDEAGLRELYRQPAKLVAAKKIDHVDEGAAAFIGTAPFVLLATADEHGRCTVSPKGGPPGFVRVLDEHRLAIPDTAGNNLIDGFRNLVVNPHIGLLFVIPGRDETLRVDGRAWPTTDPALLEACTQGRRAPKVALGVEVRTTFIHCSRSFHRGRVWDADSWAELTGPDMMEMFKAHLACNLPPDEVAEGLGGQAG